MIKNKLFDLFNLMVDTSACIQDKKLYVADLDNSDGTVFEAVINIGYSDTVSIPSSQILSERFEQFCCMLKEYLYDDSDGTFETINGDIFTITFIEADYVGYSLFQ